MGQYRTELLWEKPSATASSNSPLCCKGTWHTTPVGIAEGEAYTFLHVSLHLYSSLVSLLPNKHFSKAPLSITTLQQRLPDQFLFRTVTTSHPSALLLCTSPPAVLRHLGSSTPQTWHSHGSRAEVTTSPTARCWVKCMPGCVVCLSLVHWTSHFFAFRPTSGMWEAAWPPVT